MNCEEVEDLIAAYALGALPVDALSEIGEHLASCANHPEAADLRAVAASLAFAALETEPPPDLKVRLMRAIGAESAEPVPAQSRGGLPGWLRSIVPQRAVPYALAGALAIAIVALVATNLPDSGEDERQVIGFSGTGDISGQVELRDDGIAVLEVRGLEPLSEDETYQVWAIRSGTPQSLGFLWTAPQGEALGAFRADPSETEAIAVSVEPAEGSESPTTEPILQALLPGS